MTDRIRKLAGDWHGGQSSALYALASTGHVDADRLSREISECERDCTDQAYGEDVDQARAELAELRAFIVTIELLREVGS